MTSGGAGRSQKFKTGSRGTLLDRFLGTCTNIKVVAVELAALLSFLGLLATVLWREWHHLILVR